MLYVHYYHRRPATDINVRHENTLVIESMPIDFTAMQRAIDQNTVDHVYLIGSAFIHGWRVYTKRTVVFIDETPWELRHVPEHSTAVEQASCRIVSTNQAASWWQIGCNHGRMGWGQVFPNEPGYTQGWNYGRQN